VEGLNRTGEAGCPVVYIRGHPREPGEVNGKSGNLNNALSNVLYPGGIDPGSHEVRPGRDSMLPGRDPMLDRCTRAQSVRAVTCHPCLSGTDPGPRAAPPLRLLPRSARLVQRAWCCKLRSGSALAACTPSGAVARAQTCLLAQSATGGGRGTRTRQAGRNAFTARCCRATQWRGAPRRSRPRLTAAGVA